MNHAAFARLTALSCLLFAGCATVERTPPKQWPGDTSPSGRTALLAYWARQGIEVDVRPYAPESSPLWEETTTLIVIPPPESATASPLSMDIVSWTSRLQWWHEDGIDLVWVGSLAPWVPSVEVAPLQSVSFHVVDEDMDPPLLPVRSVYEMALEKDTLEVDVSGESFTLVPMLRDAGGGVVMAMLEGDDWEILCVSDPVLLTNAALLHPENEAWLGLVAGDGDTAILLERVAMTVLGPPESPRQPWAEWAFVAAHILLFWLIWVWARGVAVVRYPDWVRVPRRARAEHARALGRQLRRMDHHDTALRVFARWALDELRRRGGASRKGRSHDLSELMTELTRRSGLDRAEVVRRWQATLWALDEGGADAPERIAELNDLLHRTQNKRTQNRSAQNNSIQGRP